MNNLDLFKVLSDKSRLLIINSLLEEAMVVERLAKRLNLAISTVSFHLKKLEDVGLVTSQKDQYYKLYSINKEVLNQSLKNLIKIDKDPSIEDRENDYRKTVLETFFKDNKINQIPVQRKKRLILLDEIVNVFEFNKKYEEKEVNALLVQFHEDYCLLRRELIDFRYLKRENQLYERINK